MAAPSRLRRFFRIGPSAVAQRLVPEDIVDLFRRKLFPMTTRETRRVLTGLLASRVPFVLAGGWGVDALVTELKRRHSDIDIIATPDELPALVPALAGLGYARSPEICAGGWWAPEKVIFCSAIGYRIEVLVLTTERLDSLARRAEHLLGREVPRTPVRGQVAGLAVSCLSAELQLAAHDGFEMTHDQRQDFRLIENLARR